MRGVAATFPVKEGFIIIEATGGGSNPPWMGKRGVCNLRKVTDQLTPVQLSWCRDNLRLNQYLVFSLMERQAFIPVKAP